MTRMADQIGRVLAGRYRLLAPIGAGGSAQVYLAEDTRLRRRVAIKILHESYADDEGFIRRFHSEAQAAAGLNHPNLLAVYDWGDDDVPFLVTEFIGGGSLRAMLDRGRRLSLPQATLVGLQAARGLDHAHRQGLVHRDLKPANLLFGDDGRLRIADFGLARALADAAVTEPSGAVLGTARYASPEQAQGQALTGRSDVYALGLVLVEAVTGEVPFAVDTTIGTLMARVSDSVPVPERLGVLRPILQATGAVAPADRPEAARLATLLVQASETLDAPEPLPLAGAIVLPDVDVVVDRDPTMLPRAGDLDDFDDEVPEPVVVPSGPGRLARWRVRRAAKRAAASGHRRRRLVVGALALVGLLLVAAGGYGLYQVTRPEHEVPPLRGLPVSQIDALVGDLGFDVEVVGVRANGTTPGEVVGQEPAAEETLQEGQTLTVEVSRGPELADLPEGLTGITVQEATRRIQHANFRVGWIAHKFNELVVAGTVQAVPVGFEQLPRGSAINLIVSRGPRPRVVPDDLVGLTYDEAAAQLEELELVPQRQEEPNVDVPEGSVIRVDPGPGTSVPRDSTVVVVVAIAQVEVPNVLDMSPEDAADALEAVGLRVSDVVGSPNRDVIDTSPPPGTLVDPGSSVTLYTRRIQ
jgi:eukaryotic-like serine/threonine-protein kinase